MCGRRTAQVSTDNLSASAIPVPYTKLNETELRVFVALIQCTGNRSSLQYCIVSGVELRRFTRRRKLEAAKCEAAI